MEWDHLDYFTANREHVLSVPQEAEFTAQHGSLARLGRVAFWPTLQAGMFGKT